MDKESVGLFGPSGFDNTAEPRGILGGVVADPSNYHCYFAATLIITTRIIPVGNLETAWIRLLPVPSMLRLMFKYM